MVRDESFSHAILARISARVSFQIGRTSGARLSLSPYLAGKHWGGCGRNSAWVHGGRRGRASAGRAC